jgi:hypothetical protein
LNLDLSSLVRTKRIIGHSSHINQESIPISKPTSIKKKLPTPVDPIDDRDEDEVLLEIIDQFIDPDESFKSIESQLKGESKAFSSNFLAQNYKFMEMTEKTLEDMETQRHIKKRVPFPPNYFIDSKTQKPGDQWVKDRNILNKANPDYERIEKKL